jgi:CRP-like cAMP-binding protein
MLYPAPQNHLLAALAAYLPNVRDTLVPDLKRVLLKQDHVLFDAGESPTLVLFSISGAASILAKVERRAIEAAMVSREDAVGLSSIAGTNGITLYAQTRIEGQAFEVDASFLRHTLRQNGEACEIIFNCATEFFGRLALVFTRKRLHPAPQRLANKFLLTREYRHSNPTTITNTSLIRPIGGARSVGAQSRLEFRRARWSISNHCRITVLRRSQIEQTVCSCHTFIRYEKNISPVGAPP